MVYTDEELIKWWKDYSKSAKAELFDRILEALDEKDNYRGMVNDWKRRTENGLDLSPKQIGSLRKWVR